MDPGVTPDNLNASLQPRRERDPQDRQGNAANVTQNGPALNDIELTAYALGELGPAESRGVEQRLIADPRARAHADELARFAGIMQESLADEGAAESHGLSEEQKRAIRSRSKRTRGQRLWQRAHVFAALAAGVAVAGVMLSLAVTSIRKPGDLSRDATERMRVNITPRVPQPMASPKLTLESAPGSGTNQVTGTDPAKLNPAGLNPNSPSLQPGVDRTGSDAGVELAASTQPATQPEPEASPGGGLKGGVLP